jgi:hypothetical protein
MSRESHKAEALKLSRHLAAAIDHGLKNQHRDPANSPIDGQLAVMIVFLELDKLGFELQTRKRRTW